MSVEVESGEGLIVLEQCSLCSGHYEPNGRTFVTPDITRLLCKVLEVTPDGSSFFSRYVPLCPDCTRKVKKYDRVRVELDVLRRELVSSVVDTLLHIRPAEDIPLTPIKAQVISKWIDKDGQVAMQPNVTAPPPGIPPTPGTAPKATPTLKTDSPVKIKIIPTKKPAQTAPPAKLRSSSPPKTAAELIERQMSFGRADSAKRQTTATATSSGSNINGPTPTQVSWENQINIIADNEVSIVADNELEAQEILAAYVAANLAGGQAQAQVQEVSHSEEGFELPDPEDSYFDEDNTNYGDSELGQSGDEGQRENDKSKEAAAESSPKKGKKKKRKKKYPNSGNEMKVRRRPPPRKYERVPQHEKPPFFCENCGRPYSRLGTLRCHALICPGNPEPVESITCPICPTEETETEVEVLVFENWLGLKFHIDETHESCPLDKCRFCRKEFLPNTILTHKCVRTLNAEKEPFTLERFTCSFCTKVYFKLGSLNEHVRRSHPNEPKFTCTICHRAYSSQGVLDKHVHHHKVTTKTPFACNVCGTSTTTSWGLKEHMKLHTGERPYACEICGKTFRLANIKKNHMVTHTGARDFACEICGNTFTLYATMLRHWKKCRNPEGPKRGKWCPICLSQGIKYIKLKSLKDHMTTKHPGTKEQFEICSEPGNRDIGYEEENEEELIKRRSVRPEVKKIHRKAKPKVVKAEDQMTEGVKAGLSHQSPPRKSGRKRKATKKAQEQDKDLDNDVDLEVVKINEDESGPEAVESDPEVESILPDDGHSEEEEEEQEASTSKKKRKVAAKKVKKIPLKFSRQTQKQNQVKVEEVEEEAGDLSKRATSMTTRHQTLKKVDLDSYVEWINQDTNRKNKK